MLASTRTLLALGVMLSAGCPARTASPPRRGVARPAAPAVDCQAHCGRLYLCFADFLAVADPGAPEKISRLRMAGAYEAVRQTAHGACRNECDRAAYSGEAAGVVNGCLRQRGCPAFARCLMDQVYRVDCARLCRRAWGTCLEASLGAVRGHGAAALEALRREGRLAPRGAEEERQCLAECQVRDGHGPNALGLNLCLRRTRCEPFARCLQGLRGLGGQPRGPGRRAPPRAREVK